MKEQQLLKCCLLLLCLALALSYRGVPVRGNAHSHNHKRWLMRPFDRVLKSNPPKLLDLRGGTGFGFGGGRPPSCGALGASQDHSDGDGGSDGSRVASSATGLGVLFSAIKRLVEMYNSAITQYPMRTKVLSSAVVGGLGDLLIQTLTRRKAGLPLGIDVRRFAVFTTVAGLYIAPVISTWFGWLSRLPPREASNFLKAAVMMLVDQTVGAVVINAGFFFAFELAQRLYPPYYSHNPVQVFGDAWRAGVESCSKHMWLTLRANWSCWPAINFANFLFVPLQYRLLFSNVAAVFWNMFLSSVANNDTK